MTGAVGKAESRMKWRRTTYRWGCLQDVCDSKTDYVWRIDLHTRTVIHISSSLSTEIVCTSCIVRNKSSRRPLRSLGVPGSQKTTKMGKPGSSLEPSPILFAQPSIERPLTPSPHYLQSPGLVRICSMILLPNRRDVPPVQNSIA